MTVRLPTGVFCQSPVTRLVVQAENGSFGVLPNHVDFVAALVPGILVATTHDADELVLGVDEGIFVKRGGSVDVCVRRAVRGASLKEVRDKVRTAFFEISDHERTARAALARLEADIVRRFAELKDLRP
ncbi:MAG: F0F1 ATP synthase subunit epsilon [Alphaproteobacteria bacterium]|nr:F0F1 ATP synthase subunit epsilon [Alphaproteobacteria bacterium]